jgi:hypothetical protein
MHLSHRLFHFWKHCSKYVCGIVSKSFITLVIIGINCLKSSIMDNKEFRENKKSGGDRSGE